MNSNNYTDIHHAIVQSELFDADWYISTYARFITSEESAIYHYLREGASQGRFPNPLFDTDWYSRTYDFDKKTTNPLHHFIVFGGKAGLNPNEHFSTSEYLSIHEDVASHPDIISRTRSALHHYLHWGHKEDRALGDSFDIDYYIRQFPDAKRFNGGPLAHYIHVGKKLGARAKTDHQNRAQSRSFVASFLRNLVKFIKTTSKHAILQALLAANQLKLDFHPSRNRVIDVELHPNKIRRLGLDKTVSEFVPYASEKLVSLSLSADERSRWNFSVILEPLATAQFFYARCLISAGFLVEAKYILNSMPKSSRFYLESQIALADIIVFSDLWISELEYYKATRFIFDLPIDIAPRFSVRTDHADHAINILARAIYQDRRMKSAFLLLAIIYKNRKLYSSARAVISEYVKNHGLTISAETLLLKLSLEPDTDELRFPVLTLNFPDRSRQMVSISTRDEQSKQSSITEDVEILKLSYNVIMQRRSFENQKIISFTSSQKMTLTSISLLPPFGTILLNNGEIFGALSHMGENHYDLTIAGVLAQSTDSLILQNPRQRQKIIERGAIIGFNANYYHWMLEDVPRIRHIETEVKSGSYPLLVGVDITPWQQRILTLIGIEPEMTLAINRNIQCNVTDALVPPRFSRHMLPHPADIRYMRGQLLGHNKSPGSTGRRLYITRKMSSVRRRFLNEMEVISRLQDLGFEIIETETLSIDDQIRVFSEVDVLVSAGGAALTNMIFLPASSKVIVISADEIIGETFACIAASIGIGYSVCSAKSLPRSVGGPDRVQFLFDFYVDIDNLERSLSESGV